MGSCCSPDDYERVFSERQAHGDARTYRRRGLDGAARRVVELATRRLAPGFTVLEVGGGVGAIQIELLRAGASRATNVELSPAYEGPARDLLDEAGLRERVDRRVADFVAVAGEVPSADLVVMHKVVCCYRDADALVVAAARHTRRLLVLTLPLERAYVRIGLAIANLLLAVRRDRFRGYVHPLATVLRAAAREGLRLQSKHEGLIWQVVALEAREAAYQR